MELIAIWKVSTSLKFFDATEEFEGRSEFQAEARDDIIAMHEEKWPTVDILKSR